jgi:phosphatidylinositol 4-kinase type 2
MASKVLSLLCTTLLFAEAESDSSEFLRKHPLPGRAIADTFDDSNHRHGGFTKRFMSALKVVCGRTGDFDDIYDDDDDEQMYHGAELEDGSPFYWSAPVRASFREELEK